MRRTRKTPIAIVLVAACLAAAAARASLPDTPRAVIEKLTDSVLAILAKDLPTDEKRRQIEDVVYTYIDFQTVSRLVLAREWSRFTPAQQEEFVREFKKHLSLTYGDNVENYKNERVSIESEREEARGDWTVKTKVLRGGTDDILMDYRLRKTDGQWRVIDIIIEHVSLVANYCSQFRELVGSSGPEKLLEQLRAKNARGEPLKAPGV